MKAEDWLPEELLRSYFYYSDEEWMAIISPVQMELDESDFPDGFESLRRRVENHAALSLMITAADREGLFREVDKKWKALQNAANELSMIYLTDTNDDQFRFLGVAIEEVKKQRDVVDEFVDYSLDHARGRDLLLFLLNATWFEDLQSRIARSTREVRGRSPADTVTLATGPMVEFVYACSEPIFARLNRPRHITRNAIAHAIRKHRPDIEKYGRNGIPYSAILLLHKVRLLKQVMPLTRWPPMAKSLDEAAGKFAI